MDFQHANTQFAKHKPVSHARYFANGLSSLPSTPLSNPATKAASRKSDSTRAFGRSCATSSKTSRNRRFANNPLLKSRGLRFYTSAPLRTAAGQVPGSLCIMNTKSSQFTDNEKRVPEVVAVITQRAQPDSSAVSSASKKQVRDLWR